jgi:hypothetical protein
VNYTEIVAALTERKPFAFSRYGDGELLCMAGAKGSNADKHQFFKDLGKRLQETVAKPKDKITYALQSMVRKDAKLMRVLKTHSKVKEWAVADVLHRESWLRNIDSLFEALDPRDTLAVGPSRYREVFKVTQVTLPDRDCWLQHETTIAGIREGHKPGTVWVLCAGMSAAVIIYDLVDELEDATFIDAGSLFEPYVGKATRAYHKFVLKRLGK